MTYTIVICYPCPVTRQQRAQSSHIWSMDLIIKLSYLDDRWQSRLTSCSRVVRVKFSRPFRSRLREGTVVTLWRKDVS